MWCTHIEVNSTDKRWKFTKFSQSTYIYIYIKKKLENTGHLQMLKYNVKSMLKKDRKTDHLHMLKYNVKCMLRKK